MERPAVSLPGTGWKRPPNEYRRPGKAFQLVTLAQARETNPQFEGDLDTRLAFWTELQGFEYRTKVLTRASTRGWAWFELVPEPSNPQDCDAVAVDLQGVRIGYVWANIAYRLSGQIRYLNGDDQACYVPGIIRGRDDVHIVLPTRSVLDGYVDRDVIEAELHLLWEALPQKARDAIAANKFQMTKRTTKYVIELSRLSPHLGFPAVADPNRLPRAWDRYVRARKTQHAKDLAAQRDAKMVQLLADGRSRAEIAQIIGISYSTVTKALAASRVDRSGPSIRSEEHEGRPRSRQTAPDVMLETEARIQERRTASTRSPGLPQEGVATMPQPTPVGRSHQEGADQHPGSSAVPEPLDDHQTREVAAALEVWKKGLLTVSGASRLVNYRSTKLRSVQIESPSPDEILRRLDSGKMWGFQGQQAEDPAAADSSDAPARGSAGDPPIPNSDSTLQCSRPHKDLGPVLRSIMRLANTEWLDRGLRVLYLAFGMLHWRDVDDTEYTSPLVLVPVELIPLGPKDVPRLTAADDERVLNPALRVQLERLGIELPDADKLEGLDVASQLAIVQDTVATKQGWHVTGDMVLSMFSFHKEAMYKDLVENAQTIIQHPVVRILGTSDPLKQSRLLDFEPISPEDIDRLAPPETTPVLLDADSSQRAAIAAAVAGRSFVMDGPPGTGKSQTIANMVGALLHAGKSVLFVSEKAAALEVVRNRLGHLGLLPYLFELHSSKTSRKEVAIELLRSLEMKPVAPAGMSEHDRDLAAKHREELNAYASAMNAIRHPLEKSLHEVLGRISQLADAPHVPIPPSGTQNMTGEKYSHFKDLVSTLHLCWRPAEQGSSFLWNDVVEQAPLEDRLFLARRCLEDLSGAMKLNDELAGGFNLRTPSRAQSMVTLVELQHGSRPEGVFKSWLTADSLSDLDTTLALLQEALGSIRQSDDAWRQCHSVVATLLVGGG